MAQALAPAHLKRPQISEIRAGSQAACRPKNFRSALLTRCDSPTCKGAQRRPINKSPGTGAEQQSKSANRKAVPRSPEASGIGRGGEGMGAGDGSRGHPDLSQQGSHLVGLDARRAWKTYQDSSEVHWLRPSICLSAQGFLLAVVVPQCRPRRKSVGSGHDEPRGSSPIEPESAMMALRRLAPLVLMLPVGSSPASDP